MLVIYLGEILSEAGVHGNVLLGRYESGGSLLRLTQSAHLQRDSSGHHWANARNLLICLCLTLAILFLLLLLLLLKTLLDHTSHVITGSIST